MDEKNIQEALKTLHGTHDLVSKIYWSMEEKYSMENMEKIHREMLDTKGNFFNLLSNIDYLIDIISLYHGITLKDENENGKLSKELKST